MNFTYTSTSPWDLPALHHGVEGVNIFTYDEKGLEKQDGVCVEPSPLGGMACFIPSDLLTSLAVVTRSWDSLATVQCFFAFWQVLVEDFGSVILATYVAENYFN